MLPSATYNNASYDVPLRAFLPTVKVKSSPTPDTGEESYNNNTLWMIKWTNQVNGTSTEFNSTSCQALIASWTDINKY